MPKTLAEREASMKPNGFTSSELFLLETIGNTITVPPGHPIYLAGDPADRLYYIRSGRVRVFENTSSGREFTLDVIKAGHTFGESAFVEYNVRPVNVQAVTETVMISCRTADLVPYFQKEPSLALHILQMCSESMDRLARRMHEQCFLDRYGKVANYLLDMTAAPAPGAKALISLPYTHSDLAESLNLSRSTVSSVLRSFEEKGWVKSRYGSVSILDRKALSSFIKQQKNL